MTKDLAGFDYKDYYQWEWTGYTIPHRQDCAVAYWIARPHAHFALTLPCLHICETLQGADYKDAERYIGGKIIEDVGVPAQKRMKGWIAIELLMSFAIMTSKKMETKDFKVSLWNRLFHEQGLIQLSREELKDMKSFEAHLASLQELSRKPCLGRENVEKS
jgi:hypothetical protein